MAYIKTTWKDRLVERPNTFEVQENPDGTITLIPTPGTVTQAGTPVNATNLNKIEDGIATLENNVMTHLAENVTKAHGLIYEEGIWTPDLRGAVNSGTNTYSSRVGTYTRIGNVVYATCYLVLSNLSINHEGEMSVYGLPFVAKNRTAGSVDIANVALPAGKTSFGLLLLNNQNFARIRALGSNVSAETLLAGNFTNNSAVVFQITYDV